MATKKKIGVLGSGQVAQVLAAGFARHGYPVMIGSRSPEKLQAWKDKSGAGVTLGTFEEVSAYGEVVVLAVKGTVAEELVKKLGGQLSNKVIIDATNPIQEAPPEDGVLKFFTDINHSLMEKLQKAVPSAHFVKAFSCVGNALMINPQLKGGKPSMFICGNDGSAKKEVASILEIFGWEVEDMGKAAAARAIEPLCILWCIPGMLQNDWMHAFKMLRP